MTNSPIMYDIHIHCQALFSRDKPCNTLGVEQVPFCCAFCNDKVVHWSAGNNVALQFARGLFILGTNTDSIPRETMPVKKLTRQQIREGLDQIPIETLLSSGANKKANLTSKQREFARGIAMGKTKAQAYRESYNTKASAKTVGDNACRLSRDTRIQTEVEAYKLALEAEKHRTPVQLKALLVQQLVQHSLDEEFPPSARVQCLRLLGQLYEVGAFVERKEITTINRSADIRARLLATLGSAVDVEAKTIEDDALSLLEELAPALEEAGLGQPTEGAEAGSGVTAWVAGSHTIPDNRSPDEKQKYLEKSFRGDASEIGEAQDKFEDMG